MSHWVSDHPADTPQTTALVARYRRRARGMQAFLERHEAGLQALAAEIDRLRLEQRPTWPTPDMLAGLAEAARHIADGDTASSHLGQRTDSCPLVHWHEKGWTAVVFTGPRRVDSSFRGVWEPTDDEWAATLAAIETEFQVLTHWRSAMHGHPALCAFVRPHQRTCRP